MDKKIILLMLSFAVAGTVAHCAPMLDPLNPKDLPDSRIQLQRQDTSPNFSSNSTSKANIKLDTNTMYYPNATLKSGIAKYKAHNYIGSLQELLSLVKKQPRNAAAYYYMAMNYTKLGDQDNAVKNYEKVISLNPNISLVQYATKGKDCLTGGPTCQPVKPAEQDDLDKFINSPYGNGLSPELNIEVKQKQLQNIQETINKKEQLERQDLQKIRNFDNYKSETEVLDRIASASPSDEEILGAIRTLKNSGVTFAVQPSGQEMIQNPATFQNQQMSEMSVMLGNGGNNNNNNNSMMNMIPYMMQQNQNGQNIDPRMMQAVMMNSMLPDFTMNNNDNNR